MRSIHTLPLLACLLCPPVLAQNSPGTELWVAFMENLDLQFNNAPSFHLVISSEQDATGEVVVPATGFAIPFSVTAFEDLVLTLPQNIYYAEGDEAFFDFGLRVSADVPVSVYAYHDRMYFSEASLILPTTMLGSDYIVVAHDDDSDISPSEFVVLATVDGTEVEITPSVVTSSFRPPGMPFMMTLDAGQSLQIQAYQDLTGSRVRSLDPLEPIAVFCGARQARVNCPAGGADDHLYNQIAPLDDWGRDYIVVPYRLRGPVHVHVVAGLEPATVNVNGVAYALVPGAFVELDVSVPTRITSTADIAVGQFNDSQTCNNGGSGDPSFLFLPPLDHRDHRVIWNARTGDGTPDHHVNIVMPASESADPIYLDGTDVSDQFEQVPNTSGFWYAQIPIAAGHHDIQCGKPIQAVAYGFGEYNSYSFSLGYEGNVTTNVPSQPPAVDHTAFILTAGQAWNPGWNGPDQDLRIHDASGRIVHRATMRGGAGLVLPLGEGLYYFERWVLGERLGSGRLFVQ